jgi:hypothetical protein
VSTAVRAEEIAELLSTLHEAIGDENKGAAITALLFYAYGMIRGGELPDIATGQKFLDDVVLFVSTWGGRMN